MYSCLCTLHINIINSFGTRDEVTCHYIVIYRVDASLITHFMLLVNFLTSNISSRTQSGRKLNYAGMKMFCKIYKCWCCIAFAVKLSLKAHLVIYNAFN